MENPVDCSIVCVARRYNLLAFFSKLEMMKYSIIIHFFSGDYNNFLHLLKAGRGVLFGFRLASTVARSLQKEYTFVI